jgi:ADP-heptose:LPS heptosyltransferase
LLEDAHTLPVPPDTAMHAPPAHWSALVHVAGALGLPAVGLYGPFPWQLRTVHAPSIHGINGTCRCSPCFWHDREALFPPDGPCATTGRCEALAGIEPRRIVAKLRKMIFGQTEG